MATKELLVMLPAYNEEECIGKFMDQIKIHGIDEYADILVINDGSRDMTSAIAKEKGARVVTHIYNLGYGCALQTGYKYAVRRGYKYLVQIDSDGQHDVCNIETIYKQLRSTENPPDIVIGSRFFQASVSFRIPFIKKLAIKFFRFLIRRSTNQIVLDPTSGLQGLNKKAFLYYSFYDQFVYDYPDANMIIQMLLNDFKIKEIPAVMHPRETGTSMHSGLKPILYILKMILSTLVVILREKSLKKKNAKGIKKQGGESV